MKNWFPLASKNFEPTAVICGRLDAVQRVTIAAAMNAANVRTLGYIAVQLQRRMATNVVLDCLQVFDWKLRVDHVGPVVLYSVALEKEITTQELLLERGETLAP
jgi:hypothetical protein